MSFPDADAARRYPAAFAALRRGDAVTALGHVADAVDPSALRITGRALLGLGDREGARRALLAALADAADDPSGQALAHAALASVARAMGEPAEAIGHLEWALIDAPAGARATLHREAATIASRAGLLADAEFHARAALDAHHAGSAASGAPNSTAANPIAEADDRVRLGAVLSARGRHGEAVRHLERAVRTLQDEVGAGHADVLSAQAELAEALTLAGRFAAAAAAHETVLEGRAAALGENHPELAPTLLALAELRAEDGDAGAQAKSARAAAHALAARAVAVLDGRVPVDHPLLAEARAAAATWAN